MWHLNAWWQSFLFQRQTHFSLWWATLGVQGQLANMQVEVEINTFCLKPNTRLLQTIMQSVCRYHQQCEVQPLSISTCFGEFHSALWYSSQCELFTPAQGWHLIQPTRLPSHTTRLPLHTTHLLDGLFGEVVQDDIGLTAPVHVT